MIIDTLINSLDISNHIDLLKGIDFNIGLDNYMDDANFLSLGSVLDFNSLIFPSVEICNPFNYDESLDVSIESHIGEPFNKDVIYDNMPIDSFCSREQLSAIPKLEYSIVGVDNYINTPTIDMLPVSKENIDAVLGSDGGQFVNGVDVSFGNNIDSIYDPYIESSQKDLEYHSSKITETDAAEKMKYHLEEIEEAKRSENYWKDCKENAEYESRKSEIRRAEILQIPFKGNHYDQNALDFLDECHRKGVELPSSVDHSSFKSESIVDRSVDGGFKSIDKTLIRDSLNNELEKGNLSKEEYDKLDSMLSRT
ncbi:MAG: hypothetical protein J6B30_06890 [Muribaculaceae bacterium]|nr:hypothetical protein [Muribaculaceae bacterium]